MSHTESRIVMYIKPPYGGFCSRTELSEQPQVRVSLDTKIIMQTKKTDQYFLASANSVSFFFEEDAFADDGSLRQAKALSINKIGHGTLTVLYKPFCNCSPQSAPNGAAQA